ncbi:hypothetical protein, partial [Nonomuraea aurantiaca]|uniref:hypothetical protein n=1 Tax=Nonomuraea aurantiaca TaxID=2878562 RepID=UPI001CD9AF59
AAHPASPRGHPSERLDVRNGGRLRSTHGTYLVELLHRSEDATEEIRDNLIARIAEAEREGWLGEVEGLRVSLAGAEDKLVQLDARQERGSSPVFLGVPPFNQIGARGSGQPETDTEITLSRKD